MSGYRVPVRRAKPSGLTEAGMLGTLLAATVAWLLLSVMLPTRVGAKLSNDIDLSVRHDQSIVEDALRSARPALPPLLGTQLDWELGREVFGAQVPIPPSDDARSLSLWYAPSPSATGQFGARVSPPPADPAPATDTRAAKTRNFRPPSLFGSVALKTSSRALRETIGDSLKGAYWDAPASCTRQRDTSACRSGLPNTWAEFFDDLQGLPAEETIRRVNAEVNSRIRYVSDRDAFGKRDHWAGPAETLRRASGDCEDFAILKMWILHQLGFELDDMHIVVVRNRRLSSDHAILSVHANGKDLILDSLVRRVRLANRVKGYEPVYSTNAGGFWLHAFPAEQTLSMADNR